MITFEKKNILNVEAEALVNSVNTVGIMGKGVALAIKEAFPENYKLYRKVCEEKLFDIGKIFVTETGQMFPKYIINFPTKKHWKNPSKYEWIEEGLNSLSDWLDENKIKSIVIPPLGSGNGKLDWKKVKPIILSHLDKYKDIIDIKLLEPINVKIENPQTEKKVVILTPARAMILFLMNNYRILGYEVTLLVVQKLAYFLQHFGEPLRLRFEKGHYGPYAHNLLPVLNILNNSYINFKSSENTKPYTIIQNISEKSSEINYFIEKEISIDQKERIRKTLELVNGFETPFGIELLGTVDFILREKGNIEPKEIITELKNWTERKESLFNENLISVAKKRLLNFFDYN